MRPEWTDFFLGLAQVVSLRSHDENTKHGALLCDQDHRILSLGYNGLPRGVNDDEWPTTRPHKGPFMCHAEENSVLNSNGPVRGSDAYVTGWPCLNCLKTLWQSGIKRVFYRSDRSYRRLEEEREQRDFFIRHTGIEMVTVEPDFTFLVDMVLEDPMMRAILEKKIASWKQEERR